MLRLQLTDSKPNMPYTKSAKVKVLQVGDISKYTKRSGESAEKQPVILTDGDQVAQAFVYDRAHNMSSGNCYILRNYFVRNETISLVKNTKLMRCEQFAVPDELMQHRLLHPVFLDLVDLADSKPSTIVLVKGNIISDEAPRKVQVQQREQSVREVVIGDDKVSCTISLWNQATESIIKCDDTISVRGKVFYSSFHKKNIVSVNSSGDIKILPNVPVTTAGDIIGVVLGDDDNLIVLFVSDNAERELQLPEELATQLFHLENDECSVDTIATLLPYPCCLTLQKDKVIGIPTEEELKLE